MANIDDLCNKFDKIFDLLDKQFRNGSGASRSVRYDDMFSDVDRSLRDVVKRIQDMEDGIDAWDQFQREKLEREKKHLELIEKIQDEEKKIREKHNKSIEDINDKREKLEKEINDLEEKKKNATTKREKDNIQRQIRRRQNKQQDLDNLEENENESYNNEINQNTGRRRKQQSNYGKRERYEQNRNKGLRGRLNENTNRLRNFSENLEMSGKHLRVMGRSISKASPKLGKAVSGIGRVAGKAAGKLAGMVPVVGWVITALQTLGEATRQVADNHVKMKDIENKMRDASTQYNIAFAKTTAEGLVDELETKLANTLLDLNYTGEKTVAEQAVANAKNQNAVSTQLSSITDGYNEASWASLSRARDIKAMELKNQFKYGDASGLLGSEYTNGFLGARNRREQNLNTTKFNNNEQLRNISKQQSALDYKTQVIQGERELADYISDQNGFWSNLTGIPMGSTGAAAQASMYDFNQTGQSVGGINASQNAANGGNGFHSTSAIASGAATGAASNGLLGFIGGKDISTSIRDIYRANEDAALNVSKNSLLTSQANAEIVKNLTEASISAQNDIQNAGDEFYNQVVDAAIDASTEMQKSYDQFAKSIVDWTLNFEKIALDSGASKGITTGNQATAYSKFMNQTTQLLAHNWGLKAEDVMQMQNAYGQGTGRSIIGNETDMNKTAAMGKYLGDNGLAVELSNSTEIFNMGMSTTMELMWDMTKKVNKMGLDGRKYMKDMTQNLKIAQKYNFKGGVKGMMEMAKWAQNVRFDMNKLPALLEDILNNGLEGIIEKGAKLQVLGGNFAMGADPLAMMYEAMEDPAALAKRINSMTEGMGKFNSETGQVEFNGMEQRQLQLLAQYTGQDLTDVKNQASYGIKSAKMGNIFNSDLDEDQRATLVNKAYWKDGKWMVNDYKGNEMEVSQVTAEDMDNLQADTHEGRMEQMLQEIVGWQDKSVGLTEEEKATFSQKIIDDGTFQQAQLDMYNAQYEWFKENFDENYFKVQDSIKENTENFISNLHTDVKDPLSTLSGYVQEIKRAVAKSQRDISSILSKMGGMVNSAGGQNSSNPEMNRMAASIVTGFSAKGKTQDLKKLQDMAQVEYGSKKFDELYGDIIGKGSSTQDAWFRQLSDTQKDAIRNNPELFYNVIKEMSKNGNNGVENRHLSALHTSDGVMSSNGSSMLTSASNITPINDGSVQLAQSDPQDVALFAKTGGPFDTLFNGIFAKINEISNVLPRSMEYIMPLERIFNEINHSKGTANNSKIQIEPIKLIIEGKLDLGNSNGQSVDIINEVRNNPILLRTLTQLISESMEKNINGGKSTYTGGVVTPRFN